MENLEQNQTVVLESRKHLTIDGVKNVESFNDDYVEISSKFGCISVEGRDLKIEALDQQTAKIYITGEISGFFYNDTKSPKGFWNKLFK